MGFEEALKQREQPNLKDNGFELKSLVEEQQQTITEQAQQIRTLQLSIPHILQNAKLQSENQKLKSALKTTVKEIESLTSRVTIVNSTELKNKELLEKAEEIKAVSDKNLQEAEEIKAVSDKALQEAEEIKAVSDRALQEAEEIKAMGDKALQEAERERQKAKQEADRAERVISETQQEASDRREDYGTKMTYKPHFIGTGILTFVLAALTAYHRRNVFLEMGTWFANRGGNIKEIGIWGRDTFMGAVTLMDDRWGLSVIGCYVIAIVVSLMLAVGLFFLCRLMFGRMVNLVSAIKSQYNDRTLKAITSGVVAISLLYICLFFYEQIKSVVSLNIFSVWLILSAVGCLVVNFKEIAGGVKLRH